MKSKGEGLDFSKELIMPYMQPGKLFVACFTDDIVCYPLMMSFDRIS